MQGEKGKREANRWQRSRGGEDTILFSSNSEDGFIKFSIPPEHIKHIFHKHVEEILTSKLSADKKKLLILKLYDYYVLFLRAIGVKKGEYPSLTEFARKFGIGRWTIWEYNKFYKIDDEISKTWEGIIMAVLKVLGGGRNENATHS